jgi:hypothetical protein
MLCCALPSTYEYDEYDGENDMRRDEFEVLLERRLHSLCIDQMFDAVSSDEQCTANQPDQSADVIPNAQLLLTCRTVVHVTDVQMDLPNVYNKRLCGHMGDGRNHRTA